VYLQRITLHSIFAQRYTLRDVLAQLFFLKPLRRASFPTHIDFNLLVRKTYRKVADKLRGTDGAAHPFRMRNSRRQECLPILMAGFLISSGSVGYN
jgi:hypothetical protein